MKNLNVLFIVIMLLIVPRNIVSAQDTEPANDEILNEEEMVNDESEVPNEDGYAQNDALETDDENVTASAFALMNPTDEKSSLVGEVEFLETPEGVNIFASFSNVPNPGKHGIHIHEKGSCEEAGNGAGGHLNPDGSPHGFLPDNGPAKAHTGDMGNIEIDDQGEGSVSVFLPGVTLTEGPHSLAGKSVILHEKEDDFGQPTGNAGGRIACGVIELDE